MDHSKSRPDTLPFTEAETEQAGTEVARSLPMAFAFHHTKVKFIPVFAQRSPTDMRDQGSQADTQTCTHASTNEQTDREIGNTINKEDIIEECADEDCSREEIIKINLEQHLIYISHCIKPNDLILYLHCFSEEQKSDILSEKNLIKASRKALEMLLHDVEDPWRFVELRDALYENDGYPKIVRILDGEYNPEDLNCIKIVELFTPKIIERLEPSELLPHLLQKGVFKQMDVDEIRAEEKTHGKMRAAFVLLMYLPRRTVDWFRCFLSALIDCALEDIAEMLEEDIFRDIKLVKSNTQSKESWETNNAARVDVTKGYQDEVIYSRINKPNSITAQEDIAEMLDEDIFKDPGLSIGRAVKVEICMLPSSVGPFVRIQATGELCFLSACQPFRPVSIGTRVILPTRIGHENKICGKVIADIHEGQDIVLVKIANECLPTTVTFVDVSEGDLARAGISNPNLPPFEMGDILDARKLTFEAGAKSRIVIFHDGELLTGRLDQKRDVLLVEMDSGKFSFLQYSAPAVYLLENNSSVRCIGMATGALTGDTAVVTPIQDVLEELGHKIGQTLEIETFQDRTDINFILDPHDAYIFNQALKTGRGQDNYVRVNVVGYYGQGKTSLTRRLLNQSLEGVQSTDGIDVHVRKCKMKETEWESFESENDDHDCLMRLVETAKSFREVDQIDEQVERKTRSITEISSQIEEAVNQPEISEQQPESNTISNKPIKSNRSVSAAHKIADRDTGRETSFIMNYSRKLKDKSQMACEYGLSANIWDFGGQYIYYATHQIFHSKEAIYLLVFNMTKDLNEVIIDNDFPGRQRKMKNCLKFWLDSINAFVGPDDDEDKEGQQSTQMPKFRPDIVSKSKPTVIFVGTHKDEFKGNITEKFNEVMKLFAGTKSRYHISPRRFAVSSTDSSDDEIEKLRNTISLLGKEHAERKQVPLRWIPLEMALLTVKKNIITMEEVKHLNSENENLVEEEEIKTFLKYHHLKGTLIYFEEEDLEQHVVVNPQYLIDAFRCIIRSREFWVWNADLQSIWEYMNNTGILEKRLLDAVWSDEPEKDFSSNADILLRFLQRNRILAELLVMDEKGNVKYQGKYMIPSLLKQCCERNKLKQFHGESTRTRVSLGLLTKNREVLSNMFERLTAAALGKWPPVQFEDQTMVFQNVGIFLLDRQHAGQIELTTRGIQLSVINQCQQKVEAKACDHFRRYVERVINNEFHKLKRRQTDKNSYRYYLSCNNYVHGGTGSANIYEMEDVKEDELVRCPDNKNHSMECRKGVEEWFPAGKPKLSDEYNIPTRRVTQQDLVDIADCLGNNWELLGRRLGIRDVEIERIKMDYPGQTATRIYHMLHKWEQEAQENATLLEIINRIEDCESLSVDNDGMKNIADK